MSEENGNTMIPWQSREEWHQVFLSIKRIDRLYKNKLEKVNSAAIKIKRKFEALSVPMENLCSHTCVNCEDICCIRATIWYDLKDLLYIYFGLNMFPESQIIKKIKGNRERACCHFFEKGCGLSRLERPFICTWYICSVQKKYQALHHQKLNQNFDQTLLEIKKLRNKMEDEFIRISSCANLPPKAI